MTFVRLDRLSREERQRRAPGADLDGRCAPTRAIDTQLVFGHGASSYDGLVQGTTVVAPDGDLGRQLDQHRADLVAYCYRMLASPFEAEDAVQETFLRAFRSYGSFEGRAAMKTWLHRIATNVCLDMLRSKKHRVRPMDLGPAREPIEQNLNVPAEITWLEPIPDTLVAPDPDPSDVATSKESVRLAFIAALQRLPAKQRATLILCEVMQWKAAEVAELLEMSTASVNSALQRARATLRSSEANEVAPAPKLDDAQRALLARYVEAFEKYDISLLTRVIREDARQSMPPFDLWLQGRDDMFAWWFGVGIGCKGSRLLPAGTANGSPAYGQYKPAANGKGYEPWSLQVIELTPTGVGEITFFLDTQKLFPLFGLPLHLDA
ncbi:MAG: sigma-70 family RNA polymerase sigma factor [Chloroflexi bacterium]|nr:MAG: sigma-70 family RNA polymerase sigma factor [Chloroflexota bacterium]